MISISEKKRAVFLSITFGLVLLAALVGLLRLTYCYDNKYTVPPPYGKAGVFSFTSADMSRPLVLVDGWLLSVDGGAEQETFIGEFSNFSFLPGRKNPFGTAIYRIELRCPGLHALSLELTPVFGDYVLYVNETPVASTGSGNVVDFILQDRAELTLEVDSHSQYYSGMTYPPIVGTSAVVSGVRTQRTIFYTALLICALTLSIFSSVLWLSRTGEPRYLHFGLLCLSFAVLCLHPFFWYAGLFGPFSCALVDCARLFLVVEALHLCAIHAAWTGQKIYDHWVRPIALGLCGLCFFDVIFIIPHFPAVINLYGTVVDAVFVCLWALLCAASAGGLRLSQTWDAGLLTGGCCALGVAVLTNLFNNNYFEPLRFGWQMEYAGALLVLLFGVWMVRYNRQMVLKNHLLLTRMEELVQERTQELGTVLEERKNFFSDMAHNLKAPIAAVHNFIALIRDGNLYLDDELRGYLRQIESGNIELQHRVESLSTLNSFDQITDPREAVEVDELLDTVRRENAPDAGVMGIHLTVKPLGQSAFIWAQREKLLILFENLIYNAISFTPPDGSITVTPVIDDAHVVISVADTGCGIAPEHLPHIFDRFYSVREQKNEGSGLGLYISRLTVEELGGSIAASSKLGAGSVFKIVLPLHSVE